MIVQIVFDRPVRYSTDGFTMSQYEPGEYYEVPDHVARGMYERSWARIMSKQDLLDLQALADKAAEELEAAQQEKQDDKQEHKQDEAPDESEDTNRRPKKRR